MVPSSLRTARKRALSDSDVLNVESDRKKAKKIGTNGNDYYPMTMASNMNIDGGAHHPQNMSVSQMLQCTYIVFILQMQLTALFSQQLFRTDLHGLLVTAFIDHHMISWHELCSIIKS